MINSTESIEGAGWLIFTAVLRLFVSLDSDTESAEFPPQEISPA
jgi:hypothetical protein